MMQDITKISGAHHWATSNEISVTEDSVYAIGSFMFYSDHVTWQGKNIFLNSKKEFESFDIGGNHFYVQAYYSPSAKGCPPPKHIGNKYSY